MPLIVWTLLGVPAAALFVCHKIDQVRSRGWIGSRVAM